MSPHDELDLDQIDALLGEDFSEDDELLGLDDDDDFDDLLGADDEEFSEDEDSLDELLGAIDDDYLSEKEQVFLQNKSFLDSHNTAAALDNFFMKFQETLYGAMCDYAGEHDEEFGAEEDELSDIEIEVDLMGGHCFGSDEEAEAFIEEFGGTHFGDDDEEFGILPYVAAAVLTTDKQKKQALKAAQKYTLPGRIASGYKTAFDRLTGKQKRQVSRSNKSFLRMQNRQNVVATKRRYIRQLRQLNRCIKKFNRIAGRINPNIAIKVLAGKQKLVQRPFMTLALAAQGKRAQLQGFMANTRFNVGNNRLIRMASKCDRKYQTLRRIWKGLVVKGKTAGLAAPQRSLRGIIRSLSSVAKKASRKSGGMINASVAAAPVAGLSLAAARRRRAAELAKIRSANLQAQQKARKELTLAKLSAARQAIAEKRAEARSEKKELAMVASNPYMDAADMLALDRARQDRMAVNAAERQAKIQAKQRIARRKAQQAQINALRKQRALELKRRQALQKAKAMQQVAVSPKPTRVLTKGPENLAKKAIAQKKAALQRRIDVVEKQLNAASAAHRNSLAVQKKFKKGSTPYNNQYQKTKAFASKSTQLRSKLADLKSRLASL